MSYILTLGSVFDWAKNVYNYSQRPTTQSTGGDFVFTNIPFLPLNSSNNWNTVTDYQLSNLTGIFSEIDYVNNQSLNLTTKLSAKLRDLTESINTVENKLKSSKLLSNTDYLSITLDSGTQSFIESNDDYYQVFKPLHFDNDQNDFTLPVHGEFSSIRSFTKELAVLEHEFTSYEGSIGNLTNAIDSSPDTFVEKACYSNKPLVLNSNNQFHWINSGNLGTFDYLTFWCERSIKASEVFIQPASDLGFYVQDIRWSPKDQQNILTGSWSLASASVVASGGFEDGAYALIESDGSYNSYVTKVIDLASAYTSSMVNALSLSSSSYLVDNRLDLRWRSLGQAVAAQIRVLSLDSSGYTVSNESVNFNAQSWAAQHQKSFYFPNNAVSAMIQIGLFREEGSLQIDDIVGYYGEYQYSVNKYIDRPTYIQLPFLTTTSRVSLVLNQTNTLTVNNQLAYKWAIQELDIRYKEFMPRGLLLSKPVKTRKEIRKIWLRAALDSYNAASTKFVVYPYEDDFDSRVLLAPSTFNTTTEDYTDGELVEFVTDEEYTNNLYNQDPNTIKYVVTPRTRVELFNGTNSNQSVVLSRPIHLRRKKIADTNEFLTTYGANDYFWDSNAKTVYGLTTDVVSSIRQSDYSFQSINASITSGNILTFEGYVPISVTIEADSFVAYPDNLGAPNNMLIRSVTGETLKLVTAEEQTRLLQENVSGFEEWTRTTSLSALKTLGYYQETADGLYTAEFYHLPLSTGGFAWQVNNLSTTIKNLIQNGADRDKFETVFKKIAASGGTSINSPITSTTIIASQVKNIFQMANKPILTAKDLSLVNVYYSTSTVTRRKLRQTEFSIDSDLGLITLIGLTGEGATVTADYLYYNKLYQKDQSAASQSDINDFFSSNKFITRNVTDYQFGRQPTLREFEPDVLSDSFYPVIEYYVTPDSELVFNKSFLMYGDIPAKIRVEYETLDISPRFACYLVRTNPTRSTRLQSLSFGYRAASASFERSA